jgi:putative membrane protein insertion efficiency factor
LKHGAKFVMLQLLHAYKRVISPFLPAACRYVPTCSEYAMEAVERYGALRGGWMAFTRIMRCHPWASSGYDPVERSRVTVGRSAVRKSSL